MLIALVYHENPRFRIRYTDQTMEFMKHSYATYVDFEARMSKKAPPFCKT